jgi:hypothetical protein
MQPIPGKAPAPKERSCRLAASRLASQWFTAKAGGEGTMCDPLEAVDPSVQSSAASRAHAENCNDEQQCA